MIFRRMSAQLWILWAILVFVGSMPCTAALETGADSSVAVPPDSVVHIPVDSLLSISGPLRIDIFCDETRLVLSKGDFPVRDYLCAVGNDTIGKATPGGEFRVIGKIKDPPMYWKNGTRIPPGDWRNSYGPRWLSLGTAERGTYQRYGIHGTNAEHSIGKHISSGCIRMFNEDVIELFDLVPVGTRVVIH